MDKIFTNAKLIFVGLFALAVAAIWAYQVYYVIPGKKCEAAGRWWAAEYRVCGVPVTISSLTGRPNPVKAARPAPPAAAPAPKGP